MAADPPPPFPAPPHLNAWVLEPWHDADTGLFRVDRWMRDYSTWNVRVLGCAAREVPSPGKPGDPGGIEARDWLRELLPVGAPLVVSTAKPDKWGERKDAWVWYLTPAGPVNLTETLVAEGWAARWNGRGTQPKPPWPRVKP